MRILTWTAVLAAIAACSDDEIDPITKITGPRVLAITTEPSALLLDGELALTVWTVDPNGPRLGLATTAGPADAVRVRACAPWKFVTEPTTDCVGDDALPLAPDATGRIAMSAATLAAAFPSPPGIPAPPDPWRAALAAGVEIRIPIIAEVDVDGLTLLARRDVSVSAIARQNPGLVDVRFDGVSTRTLRTDQRYTLTAIIDGASLDSRPDADPGGEIETVVVNFYSPTGQLFEPEASFEPVNPPPQLLETTPIDYATGPPGSTWLFAVATDQTDGMSAVAIPLTIE